MNYFHTLIAHAESLESAAGECTTNGQPIPCDQMFGHITLVAGYGFGVTILLIIAAIFTSILGALILVRILRDPRRDPLRDRELWLVAILFIGIVGTIVYFSL